MMHLKKSLVTLSLLAATVSLATFSACSDDATGTDATVNMQAEMATARVSMTYKKDDDASPLGGGATVDSIQITRMRVLISQLKLHRDKEDTTSGDHTVKVGPLLVTVNSTGASTFTTATIPAGSYDKLKLEFHRLSNDEKTTYLSDTNYADFVTDDRYTFIIQGTAYNDGQAFPFTYRSKATANLDLKFDSAITINSGTAAVLVLRIDPMEIFKQGLIVLDPRDGSNANDFDNAIKSAIHALKK